MIRDLLTTILRPLHQLVPPHELVPPDTSVPVPPPTQDVPTPPDGIPTPKAIHDIRLDLLRSLAALDLTREAAVTYREAGNGAANAERIRRASRILGDPEFLRHEVAKRLSDDTRWLLPLLEELRPKT